MDLLLSEDYFDDSISRSGDAKTELEMRACRETSYWSTRQFAYVVRASVDIRQCTSARIICSYYLFQQPVGNIYTRGDGREGRRNHRSQPAAEFINT